MIQGNDDLVQLVRRIFGEVPPPKRLHLLLAAGDVSRGVDLARAAATHGTSTSHLRKVCATGDPFAVLTGIAIPPLDADGERYARRSLGQLLIGRLAERAFEDIYQSTLGTTEFELEDDRGSRSDTDYRVRNGARRPVFRVNIKFLPWLSVPDGA